MTASTINPCGALLVDKPAGPTSHDVVAVVRRALKTPRVGHTGTLDPLATGLLVLLVGPATRLAQFVGGDDKEYIADVRLGASTPTYDAASLPDGVGSGLSGVGRSVSGVAGSRPAVRTPSREEIDTALAHFHGTFMQIPPAFSAKKIAGVPAHERARKQQEVELAPVAVTVRELELIEPRTLEPRIPDTLNPIPDTLVRLRILASAGFYVRSLAHDLGERLGCGAHLEALRRVRAGRFTVTDALTLDTIVCGPAAAQRALIAPGALLSDLPAATLNPRGVVRAIHGNSLGPDHLAERPIPGGPDRLVRLFNGPDLVGVARAAADGTLHPIVVLAGPPEVKC